MFTWRSVALLGCIYDCILYDRSQRYTAARWKCQAVPEPGGHSDGTLRTRSWNSVHSQKEFPLMVKNKTKKKNKFSKRHFAWTKKQENSVPRRRSTNGESEGRKCIPVEVSIGPGKWYFFTTFKTSLMQMMDVPLSPVRIKTKPQERTKNDDTGRTGSYTSPEMCLKIKKKKLHGTNKNERKFEENINRWWSEILTSAR